MVGELVWLRCLSRFFDWLFWVFRKKNRVLRTYSGCVAEICYLYCFLIVFFVCLVFNLNLGCYGIRIRY